MKNKNIAEKKIKKNYFKPDFITIKLDKDVSIFMSSANPFCDPEEASIHENSEINPYKLFKS